MTRCPGGLGVTVCSWLHPDPGRHGGALKAIYRQVQLPFFGPPLWLQDCTSTPPRESALLPPF
jgi:hypothetical protein